MGAYILLKISEYIKYSCKEKELLQIDDPQELSPQNIEIPGNGKIKMLGAVATNPRQIQKP